MSRPLSALALLLCCAGCGRYAVRVPSSVVEGFTDEARLALLDAENGLAAALDKLDEAQGEVRRTREALRRAASQLKAGEAEVGATGDDRSRAVAELAVAEVEARLAWLRATQVRNVSRKELATLGVECASARFELAKAEIAQRMKLAGAQDLDAAQLLEQAKACEAELAGRRGEQKEQVAEVDATREQWEARKAVLAERTADGPASMFVE